MANRKIIYWIIRHPIDGWLRSFESNRPAWTTAITMAQRFSDAEAAWALARGIPGNHGLKLSTLEVER